MGIKSFTISGVTDQYEYGSLIGRIANIQFDSSSYSLIFKDEENNVLFSTDLSNVNEEVRNRVDGAFESIGDLNELDTENRGSVVSAINELNRGILVASSASQMTNTGAIYKYTGSESGYEPDGLYYHNGTEWKLIINNDLFAPLKNKVIENLDSIDYDQLSFGKSTGVQKIYFTGNVPTTATTYGVIGRVIQCSAGDTIYMSGTLSTSGTTNVKILSAIPNGQFGSIPNASIIGTLEQTEDNVYTIPSSLTNCVAAFFPATFTGFPLADYQALNNGVIEEDSAVRGYYAGSNQLAKHVSKLPFTVVTENIVAHQKESFWIGDDYNKAFYASLFKSVSPLVNAKIALLGDSLSEQSALKYSYEEGWLGKILIKYSATGQSWAVGQQRWYNTSSLTKGAVWQVKQLLASDFIPDYVIFEFGTNDIWSGSSSFGSYEDAASDSTQKTSCAMRWCIETIQENYPSARILCIMPMLRNNNGLKPSAQDTYIAMADQILDDYSIHRVYPYTDSGIVYDMMKEDGIHLAKMNGNYYDNANSEAVKKYSAIVQRGLLAL